LHFHFATVAGTHPHPRCEAIDVTGLLRIQAASRRRAASTKRSARTQLVRPSWRAAPSSKP